MNFEMMNMDIQNTNVSVENGFTKHTLYINPPLASPVSTADGANLTNAMILNTARNVFHKISGVFGLMASLLSIHCLRRNSNRR